MITHLTMVLLIAVGIILVGFGLFALAIVYARAGTNMEELIAEEDGLKFKLKRLYISVFSFVVIGFLMLLLGMDLLKKTGGIYGAM